LLKANRLQLAKRHFKRHGQAVIASLLVGLVLLLGAMAACPSLHELIHHDADKPSHQCAVTVFAHGKVDSAVVDVPVPTPQLFVQAAPQFEIFAFSPAIQNLPSGRAPPALPAVS
jgi:hypothetical protein